MSNILRKFKRKQAVHDAYELRKQAALRRQLQIRKQKAMDLMHDAWKQTVKQFVPPWIMNVGLSVPPRWYMKAVKKLLDKILTQQWIDSIIFNGKTGKWTKFRVNFNLTIAMRFKWLVGLILIGWLMWLRASLCTFGITTRFFESGQARMTMEIRYFFRLVCSKEISV